MPEIIFTSREKNQLDAVLAELDPASHDLLIDYNDTLSSEDWNFVCDYLRSKLRAVLEAGLLIGSVTDVARASKLVDEAAVRSNFVKALWNYNFSFSKAIEDTFLEIAGGRRDAPLCVAAEALIEIAEDRMFGTFEDAHEQLLGESAEA